MWKDVIELGNLTETIIYGEAISSMEYREVFANKKSVKQSEFYQAANAGLKPELVFEIRSIEFNNDESVKYNGKSYSIIRTYDKGELTELVITSNLGGEV